jgi:hypothetical protein
MGHDTSICNDYNQILCQRVEEESMCLFDFITDYDYLPIYLSYFGVYSQGFKRLGLDASEIIMRNATVIEKGEIEARVTRYTSPDITVESNMAAALSTILSGGLPANFSHLGKGNKRSDSRNIHHLIAYMIENRLYGEANRKMILFCLQYYSFSLGKSKILMHAADCFGIMYKNKRSLEELARILSIQNRYTPHHLCKHKEESDVPTAPVRNPLRLGAEMVARSANEVDVVLSHKGIEFVNPAIRPQRIFMTENSVPYSGVHHHVHISHQSRKINANLRSQDVRPFLVSSVDSILTYETIQENMSDDPCEVVLNALIKAFCNHDSVILTGYDQLGSRMKKSPKYSEFSLQLYKKFKLYVPDRLLFNVISRDINYVDTAVAPPADVKILPSEPKPVEIGYEVSKIAIMIITMVLVSLYLYPWVTMASIAISIAGVLCTPRLGSFVQLWISRLIREWI